MKKILMLSFLLVVSACSSVGAGKVVNSHTVDGMQNVAIKGYDPVAYFTMRRPVEGSSNYTHQWNGATWKFANEEHLSKFKEAPEKFAPQYGGYCAYGVAVPNKKIDIEADAWYIQNGKLYLNYTPATQKIWLKNKVAHIKTANIVWPELKDK